MQCGKGFYLQNEIFQKKNNKKKRFFRNKKDINI